MFRLSRKQQQQQQQQQHHVFVLFVDALVGVHGHTAGGGDTRHRRRALLHGRAHGGVCRRRQETHQLHHCRKLFNKLTYSYAWRILTM
jgi:hypothetical protein